VQLRIKRERVSGFQRDIKGFVSAFYISKTGIYRFFVNNGKLVDACLNYGESFCPEKIADRSICIDGDIGEVFETQIS